MARTRKTLVKRTPLLRIRAEREARGWTLEDLAGKLGVARQTVGRWETSGRDVGVSNLIAIANVMGISVRLLFPGDDGLAADERELLAIYRAAPAHERRAILGMASTLSEGRAAEASNRPSATAARK